MEPVHFHGSLTKGTKSEVATSPLSSHGPKEGGIAMQTLHSRGSPTKVDYKGGYAAIPPSWAPREGRDEIATSDLVPFVGDPRECRGRVLIPPSFGPPRRQG